MRTAGECVNFAYSQLERIDAEYITQYALDMHRTELVVNQNANVTSKQRRLLQYLIEQKQAGVPVAHLVGSQGFWRFIVEVSPDVLIPRPETELLVETVLPHINTTSRVLDLGTGSGAIAIAIASETSAQVVASDISRQALDVCRQNTDTLNVELELVESSWYAEVSGTFDVIVSNPPYLAEDDPHLDCGDLRFEPRIALISGSSGLESLGHVILEAPAFLNENGLLAVEHGFTQSLDVQKLFSSAGFLNVQSINDLNDLPRITFGFLQ